MTRGRFLDDGVFDRTQWWRKRPRVTQCENPKESWFLLSTAELGWENLWLKKHWQRRWWTEADVQASGKLWNPEMLWLNQQWKKNFVSTVLRAVRKPLADWPHFGGLCEPWPNLETHVSMETRKRAVNTWDFEQTARNHGNVNVTFGVLWQSKVRFTFAFPGCGLFAKTRQLDMTECDALVGLCDRSLLT